MKDPLRNLERPTITPEDEDDIADHKAAAYERAIDHADHLRDEMKDRRMEALRAEAL
jgi:hypothetical protein